MLLAPNSDIRVRPRPHSRLRVRLLAFAVASIAAFAIAAAHAQNGSAAFQWEGTAVAAVNPGMIATDGAGRIYVPLRHGGVVQVYDNARNGHRPLTNFGSGLIQDPVSVTVDIRGNTYVADAGRNVVLLFGPYISGSSYLGTVGGPGTALGQFGGPRQIANDNDPRIYVAEALNGRVQALAPARGSATNLFAFGVAYPGPFGVASGVAVDARSNFIVSSETPGTSLRYFDSRGGFVGGIGTPGAAPGQFNGPRGLATDPIGRLLVADTGNHRVSFFNTFAGGFGFLGQIGSAGAGVGNFNAPGSLATAPGALLYVADNGNQRVVRLRYDDADRDGAIDATDGCPGIFNPNQTDRDGDRRGDDCDDDIDGDGIGNPADVCPFTKPFDDRNSDGCQDPTTSSVKPKSKKKVKRSRGLKISGRAYADRLGVARVLVAVGRREARKCSWYSVKRKRFLRGSCKRPRYSRARGTRRWRMKISAKSIRPGRYRIYTKAVQKRSRLVEKSTRARSTIRVVR